MRNNVCFDFLRICLLVHICFSQAAHLPFRQASNKTVLTLASSSPRKVHVITSLSLDKRAISLKSGRLVFGGHSSIWIDGTATDGPLLIEIGFTPRRPAPDRKWAIRSKDFGVHNTGMAFPTPAYSREIRHEAETGSTSSTNADLFDPETGRGLIADAWNEDPVYVIGTGARPNSCYDLVVRVLARMDLKLDPFSEELFEVSEEYYTSYSRTYVQRVQDVASFTLSPLRENSEINKVHTRVFNVDFVQNPDAPSLVFEEYTYEYVGQLMESAAFE